MENSTIETKGVSLVNISSVTISVIDERVLGEIAEYGTRAALSRAAHGAACGTDIFYRTALHVGLAEGVFNLPSDEKGGYPRLNDTVKTLLDTVSLQSTNSQRKYFGQVLRYSWIVTSNGYNPLDFPSFPALRKVAAPVKSISIRLEQDSINEDVIAQYNAGKIAEAEAKARALAEKVAAEQEAEAAKAAEQEAETKRTHMQAQVDAIRADVASLKEALQGALYGTTETRKALRASYPKV